MIRLTDKYAFFYNEWPSKFAVANFEIDGHNYFCVEQALEFNKAMYFNDDETAAKILRANTALEVTHLGRRVKNYDDAKWDKARVDIMTDIIWKKYTRNNDALEKLMNPKFDGKTFVNASPEDGIWGIKMAQDDSAIEDEMNWKGHNLLGKILTEIRAELKEKLHYGH